MGEPRPDVCEEVDKGEKEAKEQGVGVAELMRRRALPDHDRFDIDR